MQWMNFVLGLIPTKQFQKDISETGKFDYAMGIKCY